MLIWSYSSDFILKYFLKFRLAFIFQIYLGEKLLVGIMRKGIVRKCGPCYSWYLVSVLTLCRPEPKENS